MSKNDLDLKFVVQVTALSHATFQTLRWRFLSLAPGVLSHITLCDIYCKRKGFGSKLFNFFAVPLPIIIPPLLLTQLSTPSAICKKPKKQHIITVSVLKFKGFISLICHLAGHRKTLIWSCMPVQFSSSLLTILVLRKRKLVWCC